MSVSRHPTGRTKPTRSGPALLFLFLSSQYPLTHCPKISSLKPLSPSFLAQKFFLSSHYPITHCPKIISLKPLSPHTLPKNTSLMPASKAMRWASFIVAMGVG